MKGTRTYKVTWNTLTPMHTKINLSAQQITFHDHGHLLTNSSLTSHATVQQATEFRPCHKHS